ncbi:cytochrome c [Methylococcus sp. EFPC2]|uniref:c-type cytochrome n=1 Tax=Methylococcus sp. EFPC2 TaxID=2812648 RepID=UPI001966EC03|nr:c-type cytochrome [Methylococcus sp. EFPC2]QSA96344.1 c-type cytochrome [Methylococcus sp. EFPC2]
MKRKTLWSCVAIGLGLTMVASFANAAGDAESGKKKFYTCAGCHSVAGYDNSYPSVYPVPKLGGQHDAFIIAALKSYLSGERKHGSMEGNAAGLSDRDLEDIGAYLTRFRSITESNVVTGNAAAGKGKTAICASCHGEDGNSENNAFPRLAGQYEGYLIKVLQDYKRGKRTNPMMAGFAAGLSEEDIKDISAYYASQKRGLTLVND